MFYNVLHCSTCGVLHRISQHYLLRVSANYHHTIARIPNQENQLRLVSTGAYILDGPRESSFKNCVFPSKAGVPVDFLCHVSVMLACVALPPSLKFTAAVVFERIKQLELQR